jgi:6-pyruvoyl-tetrahydropterin synthase
MQGPMLDFKSLHNLLHSQIELEKQFLEQQEGEMPRKKGRGGNNIAENIKKAFLAILRKRLPLNVSEELSDRFIQPYNLKSQKENIFLFFMFLHLLLR